MENREHFGTLTERMHSFRGELLNTEASIDATRAVLATQAYQAVSYTHLDVYKRQEHSFQEDILSRKNQIVPLLSRAIINSVH